MTLPSATLPESASRPALWPYVKIARIDHWFKNSFMLLGVLLAIFYQAGSIDWANPWPSLGRIALAFFALCLVASGNYVINELLDGPSDRMHPEKRSRVVPSGLVRPKLVYLEWLALSGLGISLGLLINPAFTGALVALWVMGIIYNVPPVRSKELPYIDVLTESINNPIRLFLGWFAVIPDRIPPMSLILAYWMAGAFFMGAKRYAELRHIGDRRVAALYRKSFRHYTEENLLVSLFFYATSCALFAGIFMVRYHLELIAFVPVAAGFFAFYLKLSLKPDSPVQNPERLYKEKLFFAYAVACLVIFVLLMFTSIPPLYRAFNVEPSRAGVLWTLGGSEGQ
jgi:4-hydroxybenzoate polyprenyltransferase